MRTELLEPAPALARRQAAAGGRYSGPERRSGLSSSQRWLAAMLDEIDYPMLLLHEADEVVHVNRAARRELDDQHPLQLVGRALRVRRAADLLPLREGLDAAQGRGLRRLVSLGEPGAGRVAVAIIPIDARTPELAPATLLVLGRRQLCETLTVDWFAREHGLTPAEAQVLKSLCAGLRPQEIAERHGVALSTVRTQVGSLRAKTGAASIRELVSQVSMMPPLVGVLGRSLGDTLAQRLAA